MSKNDICFEGPGVDRGCDGEAGSLKGYLAHKKLQPPVGPIGGVAVYLGSPIWRARALFHSKVDEYVPQCQDVNLRKVGLGETAAVMERRSGATDGPDEIEKSLRFRGGLVFKADRLCVSLNSRLESNKERERENSLWSRPEGQPRPHCSGIM